MDPSVNYVIDPDDPRAPDHDVWEQMSSMEHERLIEMLPAQAPLETTTNQGDLHRIAKADALDALGSFFRRSGRRVYVSSDLAIYYPGLPCFVPDVLVVLDAEPHPRTKWIVSKERRGLDLVLDVRIVDDGGIAHERNLVRYAELGIPEYFLFDRGRSGLRGFRLPSSDAFEYEPIQPQGGRFGSSVLGIDLTVHGNKLRFFEGTTPLLLAEERIAELEEKVEELANEKANLENIYETARQAADQEGERANRAERVVARLRGEIARMKPGA